MEAYASICNMNRHQQGLYWLVLSAGLAAATAWLGYTGGQANQAPLISALTWTGRLAFTVFLIPLFASPMRALWRTPLTARLLRWRRNAGIAYGGIQCVHLVLILAMFVTIAAPPVESAMVVIGGLGMLLALMMLWTSFDGPTRRLGPQRWRLLHKSGFYVFMFIYVYDFVVEPLMFNSFNAYVPYAALTLGGMALRTAAWLKPARKVTV